MHRHSLSLVWSFLWSHLHLWVSFSEARSIRLLNKHVLLPTVYQAINECSRGENTTVNEPQSLHSRSSQSKRKNRHEQITRVGKQCREVCTSAMGAQRTCLSLLGDGDGWDGKVLRKNSMKQSLEGWSISLAGKLGGQE